MASAVHDGGEVRVSTPVWSVSASQASWSVAVESGVSGGVPYDGPYEVEPSDAEQVLRCEERTMARDVVIAPIPSNYGLVTWNGSVITVS